MKRERERAFGEPGREQPAVAPQPREIEPQAELEQDEAESDVDEDPRLVRAASSSSRFSPLAPSSMPIRT